MAADMIQIAPRPMTFENIEENTFEAARACVFAQTKAAEPGKRTTFWVPSIPKGQARATPHPHDKKKRFTTSETQAARQDIIAKFTEKVGAGFRPWDGPVLIEVIDCHYKKSAYYGEHCRRKPDWDNSGKLVGDALNGVAWGDDAIIISGLPQKTYYPWAGKWVRLTFYHPLEKPQTGTVKLTDTNWVVMYHGLHVGNIAKSGSRYHAQLKTVSDGYWKVTDETHPTGNFRNVTSAADAILARCYEKWSEQC